MVVVQWFVQKLPLPINLLYQAKITSVASWAVKRGLQSKLTGFFLNKWGSSGCPCSHWHPFLNAQAMMWNMHSWLSVYIPKCLCLSHVLGSILLLFVFFHSNMFWASWEDHQDISWYRCGHHLAGRGTLHQLFFQNLKSKHCAAWQSGTKFKVVLVFPNTWSLWLLIMAWARRIPQERSWFGVDVEGTKRRRNWFRSGERWKT